MKCSVAHIAKLAQYTCALIAFIGCALSLQRAFSEPLVSTFVAGLACFGGLIGFFVTIAWQAHLEVKSDHARLER